jgi:hypothetical protein
MTAGRPSFVRKPVPLYMAWPVNAGWSFVVCQVQCSRSGLVTWTKLYDRSPCH